MVCGVVRVQRVEAQKEKGETDLIADDHTLQRLAGMMAKLQTMVPGEVGPS